MAKIKDFLDMSSYSINKFSINSPQDESGNFIFTHNALHNEFLHKTGKNSKHNIIMESIGSDKEYRKGIMYVESNTPNNNAIKLYAVTVNAETNTFNIDTLLKEVDSVNIVTRRGGVTRVSNTKGKSNAQMDFEYVVDSYFNGHKIKTGSLVNVTKNPLAETGYSSFAKVSKTNGIPNQRKTLNLDISRIRQGLDATKFEFSVDESKKLIKNLFSKEDILENITDSKKLIEKVSEAYLNSLRKSSRVFIGVDLKKSLFLNKKNISRSSFEEYLDRTFVGKDDFFNVKNQLKGFFSKQNYVSHFQIEKALDVLGSSYGIDLKTSISSNDDSLENKVISTLHNKLTSLLNSNKNKIDEVIRSPNGKYKLETLLNDIFLKVDPRQSSMETILKNEKVVHMHQPNSSPMDLLNLSSVDNDIHRISVFAPNSSQVKRINNIQVSSTFDNSDDIYKVVSKSDDTVLKQMHKTFGNNSELLNKAYNYYKKGDAIVFTDNLSESDLVLKNFFDDVYSKRTYLLHDLNKDTTPSAVGSVSIIGNHTEKLDSFLNNLKFSSQNKVMFSKRTDNYVDIGFKGELFKLPILKENVFTELKDFKRFEDKVSFLKSAVLESVKDSSSSEQESFMYGLNYVKGKNIRYSSGVNTEFYSLLMSQVLNSLTPQELKKTISKYDSYQENIRKVYSQQNLTSNNSTITLGKMDQVKRITNIASRKENKFFYFDIETSGFDGNKDFVDEISFIRPSTGKAEKISMFIGDVSFPQNVADLRNLTKEDVNDIKFNTSGSRVSVKEGISKFLRIMQEEKNKFGDDLVITGHNIEKFDINFLSKNSKLLGLNFSFNHNTLDTLELAKTVYGNSLPNNKLSTLYEYLTGKKADNAHDSINDILFNKAVLEKTSGRIKTIDSFDELKKLTDSGELYSKKDTSFIIDETLSEHLSSNMKTNNKLVNKMKNLTTYDLLDDDSFEKLLNESNEVEKSYLRNARVNAYKTGLKLLYTPEGTFLKGHGLQVNLGQNEVFKGYYHVDKNMDRELTNDYLKAVNKVSNILGLEVKDPYDSLHTLSRINSVDDLDNNNLVLSSWVKDVRIASDIVGKEAFSDEFQILLDRAKKIRELNVSNSIDMSDNKIVLSTSYTNKAQQAIKDNFFESPVDYLHIGHHSQDESARFFQSTDLQPIDQSGISAVVDKNETSVVNELGEVYKKSVNELYGSDLNLNNRLTDILYVSESQLSFDSSSVLTKDVVVPLKTSNDFHKTVNLDSFTSDKFKKVFGSHTSITKVDFNNFNPVEAFNTLVKDSDIDSTINHLLSHNSKVSFYIDKLEKETAKRISTIGNNADKYNELSKLELKVKAIKNLSSKYSMEQINDIMADPVNFDNQYLKKLSEFKEETHVSTDKLNRKIYDLNHKLQKGIHKNHSSSLLVKEVGSQSHKVYDGIGYSGSYVDGNKVIVQMKSYSAPTSASKYSVQSIKTDARIVDKLDLVTEGVTRKIGGVLKGEISKRGLDQFKHYLFVQTALNNLEHKEASEFLAENNDLLSLMKMKTNYENGVWKISDPLTTLLIENGFDMKKDNLLEFLKTNKSDDLFRKNMSAFNEVKNKLMAKYQTLDNVILALNNVYEKKINNNAAKKIIVSIDKIIESTHGIKQEIQNKKTEYGMILSSNVNRMIDIDAFEHGGAMKISYFSESLLDVAGYGSYRKKVVSKNRRGAFEYLLDVDNRNSQKSIGEAISKSYFSGNKSKFKTTTETIKRISDKHFSGRSKNDWLNTDIKRTAFINVDELNMSYSDLEYSLSNADILFKHDVIDNELNDSKSKNIVTYRNSEERYKYNTVVHNPTSVIQKDAVMKRLSQNEEFVENINDLKRGGKLFIFENILGAKIAESGAYAPNKNINGKIALYSKKNVEMFESMEKSIRLYLDNVPIDTYGSESISYHARMFFNGLLKGEDTLKNKSVLSDIEENLNLIKDRLILNNETSADDIFGFMRLKNIISIAKDSRNSPRGFQNALSFFKNKGYFYREINLSNVVSDTGEIISSEGLKDFLDFYKGYDSLNLDESSLKMNIVRNLQDKNYMEAVSDLKKDLGKFYQAFPDRQTLSNLIDKGVYEDGYTSHIKNTLSLLKKKYSVLEILTTSQTENVKKINDLLTSIDSFYDTSIDSNVIKVTKKVFLSEFGKVVSEYEKNITNLSDDITINSENIRKLKYSLFHGIESNLGSSNYFKQLLKTSYEFFSVTDKRSSFFTLLRERISDSTFVRPVDGSSSLDGVLDILFTQGKTRVIKKNISYLDEVFGKGFFYSLLLNDKGEIADYNDWYDVAKENLSKKSNYLFTKSDGNGITESMEMIARHPTQTTLHFSAAKKISLGSDVVKSENPFLRHFYSKVANFKNSEQVYTFGDLTLKMMLGDFDSDDIVLSKMEDSLTNNLMSTEHAIRNNISFENLTLRMKSNSPYSVSDVLDRDAKLFLKNNYSIDVGNEISGTIRENLNYFVSKVSGVNEEFLDVKKFYFDSASRMFKGNVDAEKIGTPEKFIGFVFKLTNNEPLYNEYLKEIESVKGDNEKIIDVLRKTYLKAFSGDYINDSNKLSDDVEKFTKEALKQFSVTNNDELYSKAVNIKNTGVLYEYISKMKISNESLISLNIDSYKSAFGGKLDVDSDSIKYAAHLADQFYSSAIQTPIGAKHGKSLDLASFKVLVDGVRKDSSTSDYFHELYENVYGLYIKNDTSKIERLKELLPSSNVVSDEVFSKLSHVDLTDDSSKLSHYYKNAFGFTTSHFKGLNETELFEAIKNKDLENVHLKDFLVQFSSFYETVIQTQKTVHMHQSNIVDMFMKNSEFLNKYSDSSYNSLVSDFSDALNNSYELKSFESHSASIVNDLITKATSIRKYLSGIDTSGLSNDISKNINDDLLNISKVASELDEFNRYYKSVAKLSPDVLIARMINPDAEIFTNKNKEQIEKKSWAFSNFYDEFLSNKYATPIVGEASSLYHSKLSVDVVNSIKSVLLTQEFFKNDRNDILFFKESLSEKDLFSKYNSNLLLSDIINDDVYKNSTIIRKKINTEFLVGLNKEEVSNFFKSTTLNDVYEKLGLNVFWEYDKVFNEKISSGEEFFNSDGKKITDSVSHFLDSMIEINKKTIEFKKNVGQHFGVNLFEGDVIGNIMNNKEISSIYGLKEFLSMYENYKLDLPKTSSLLSNLFDEKVVSAIESSELLGINQNVDELLSKLFKNASKLAEKSSNERLSVLFHIHHNLKTGLEGSEESNRLAKVLVGGFDKFVGLLTGGESEETVYGSLKNSINSVESLFGKIFGVNYNSKYNDLVYSDVKLENLKINKPYIYDYISSSVSNYADSLKNDLTKYADLNDFKVDEKYFNTFKELLERDIVGKLDEKFSLYNADEVKAFIETLPETNRFSKVLKEGIVADNLIHAYMQNSEHTFNSSAQAVEGMASVANSYENLKKLPKIGLASFAIFGTLYGVQKIRQHRLEKEINEAQYKKELLAEEIDYNLQR